MRHTFLCVSQETSNDNFLIQSQFVISQSLPVLSNSSWSTFGKKRVQTVQAVSII